MCKKFVNKLQNQLKNPPICTKNSTKNILYAELFRLCNFSFIVNKSYNPE